jgi:chromosome partitioning protein
MEMATVVTIMNMKGGVGKTTATVNIGGFLSRYYFDGKKPLKTLVIDYDPQFNLSQSFLASKKYFKLESDYKTTLSILVDDANTLNAYKLLVPGNHSPPKVADLATTVFKKNGNGDGGLDIIPSTLDLMYVALGQAATKVEPIEERFQKFITEARSLYELILIDCHPAGSLFTKTSLTNSDFVLIPVVPKKFAVRGIGLMLEFIKAKKPGTKSPDPWILFNSTARTGVSAEESAIRADGKYAPLCMANTLKWYKAFGEPEEGSGFVWESKAPYSTQAFNNLLAVAREFRNKVGL